MDVEVESVTSLVFPDGAPVRAASALVSLGPGWLIAQDDTTYAAWWRDGAVRPVRIFPPVEGHDLFDEAAGTKHLKPDLEAGCVVDVHGRPGALLLGSGSSGARMRGALVTVGAQDPEVVFADLTPVYDAVAAALAVPGDQLNLEGACVVGTMLRWFHRGQPSAGWPTASVDLPLEQVVAAVSGAVDPTTLRPVEVRAYDLGEIDGVGLAVTDAVALDGAGRQEPPLIVTAAAEDTPDPRADGPVVGSALMVLDGTRVRATAELPRLDGEICKVEGLAVIEQTATTARLLATVDADDQAAPSHALRLRLRW